jgi:hypothetical protein
MMTPSTPNVPIRVTSVPQIIDESGAMKPGQTYIDAAGKVWKYLMAPAKGPSGQVQYQRVAAAAPGSGIFGNLGASLSGASPLVIGAGVVALALLFSKGKK